MTSKDYDGVVANYEESGFVWMNFDISKALEDKNPRNVFINGQLFVEMQCDDLLLSYFCSSAEGNNDGAALTL